METHTIALAQIVVIDNYRKSFDSADLQELAQSIRQHGILQAVTLRPHPLQNGRYELIIGERRLRAAQLAALSHIPAQVRALTDEQADEIRLIENIQRKEAHPIDEAAGILRLVRNGKTHKEVADTLGKSEGYVTQRLSLNALLDYWKEMFLEGGLNLSGAFQIARLGEDNQKKLGEHFKKENYQHEGSYVKVIPPQAIKDFAERHFFLNLHQTDFSKEDSDLYPQAGSCLNCTRRTGCNQLLFSELTKDDFCTQPSCFEEKNQRHLNNGLQRLQAENVPYHQLATHYSTNPAILNRYDYKVVEQPDEDSEKGIIVEGHFLGRIVEVLVQKKNAVAQTLESKQEAKVQRRAVIRSNRIKKLSQRIAGERVINQFQKAKPKDEQYAQMLDYLIIDRMGNGQSNEFLEHFIERYGWKTPIDRNNYMLRSEMIATNVRDTPVSRKLEMFVDLFVHQKAIAEWGEDIVKLVKYVGLDWQEVLTEAADEVDAKGNNAKQNALSEPVPAAA